MAHKIDQKIDNLQMKTNQNELMFEIINDISEKMIEISSSLQELKVLAWKMTIKKS